MAAPLKHGLSRPAVIRLARNLETAFPELDVDGFIEAAMDGLTTMELKERVAHIAAAMFRFLPEAYSEAVAIIVSAGKTWVRGEKGDSQDWFTAWPLVHFIEEYGQDDFNRSMSAMRATTHLASAEFAVRPYIEAYPEKAFAELGLWTKHKSEQVRRLVSEGTRSRLPWATKVQALIDDPEPTIELLELLKDDSSLFVRRSVANNLNDIAKDFPDRVIDICESWLKKSTPERRWIVERATRTLVKAGHPRVWGLLGFTPDPKVTASEITLDKDSVALGGQIAFAVSLISTTKTKQRLAVDYAVHFMKANGKTKPKVFKLKVLDLAPGATVALRKSQSFRPISTRKYYPGTHGFEVLVNGQSVVEASFEVE